MKGRAGRYFLVLLKRSARLLPLIMALCLLLLSGVTAYAAATKKSHEDDASNQIIKLGLVADRENKYVKLAMQALESFDYSRYSLLFIPCEEEDARAAVKSGEISGYVVIPENFFDLIAYGEHTPIRYCTEKEETAFGLAMTGEAIKGIAQVLLSCENSIYGIQRFIVANHLDADQIDSANALIARYFAHAVRRGEMYEIVQTGVSNNQNFTGYFFVALLTFFFMLFGVCMAPAYTEKRRPMQSLLKSEGVGGGAQLFGEYAAHLLVTFAGTAIVTAGALLAINVLDPSMIGQILPDNGKALWFLRVGFLAVPFAAISYFFYECSEKIAGALLLQVLFALLTGYISGCFYPSYFFSPAFQSIGAWLPAGVAMRFIAQPSAGDLTVLLLYTALPLVGAFLLRKKRLAGDRA